MVEHENNRPSPAMEEIYKDFAIIHADSERALSLLRGLDEKLKRAIAATTPSEGNGDRWYQFYGLRMNCLDCTAALLKQFDSEFEQDILRRAEVAIADPVKPWDIEIPPTWISMGPGEDEMRNLLLRLTKALGKEHLPLNLRTHQDEDFRRDRLSEVLTKLTEIAEAKAFKQRQKDIALDRALSKIHGMVIPLLNLREVIGETQDSEDFQDNLDTLIDSAQQILESALKEFRESQIPH